MKAHPLILFGMLFPVTGQASPVILNEFNVVGNSESLPDNSVDVSFGRRAGNGGDWFELVVTGNGRGSSVDLRGWKIQAARSATTPFVADDTLELSDDPFWAAVPAGTILTFTESREAEGGRDTMLGAADHFNDEGWGHSNVWIGDPNLIRYTDPLVNGYELDPVLGVSGFNLNEDNTRFLILDAAGLTVFGPAGEGVNPNDTDISDREVFALQQTPSDSLNPDADYGETSKGTDQLVLSTFGQPNRWWVGGSIYRQSFEAFRPGSVAPVILSSQVNITLLAGSSFTNQVSALDADGGTVALDLLDSPAFLTLTDLGNGSGSLSAQPGPNDTGSFVVRIRARDGDGNEHLQGFVITVLPAASPVLVNEYNAVSSGDILDRAWSFDQRFQLRKANGDDWIELVVMGDGTPGSTLDLRSWKVVVEEDGFPAGSFTLTDDPFWESVQAGTILTFTESDFSGGGWDTQINADNRTSTEGWAWSNVFLGDSNLIDQSTGQPEFGITGDETKITILDDQGMVRAGPFGEGVFSTGSVSSDEVFRLAGNPSPAITPLDPAFADGSVSTFGHPNRLQEADGSAPEIPEGTSTGYQSFLAFATASPSVAPFFTNYWGFPAANNTLPGLAWNGPLLTASDPDHSDSALSFSISQGPAGLSLVDLGNGSATWSWTPNANQIGNHQVTVRVSDPNGSYLEHITTITVMPPDSPVLVNEYNAVSSGSFLNDGNLEADIDGGTATDTLLGRVQGNGGDWFELVVVGDGTANSTVDLRGWTIELRENFDFNPETIVLSQNDYWSNVRAGTILTFMERDLAGGGFDTGIHRINRFADLGYAWTNIVTRDLELVDQEKSNFGSSIEVTSSQTEITLKDATGVVRNGPVGETRILRNVNSREVFHLEANPDPGITASISEVNFPYYADHSASSSLGTPNSWTDETGSRTQDFTPFITSLDPNSRPTFIVLPADTYIVAGTSANLPIRADDFDGLANLSFTALAPPPWVTVTDNGNGEGSITFAPPAGEKGPHTITLQLSDGIDLVSRSIEIFVHPSESPVLINEYNAVSSSNFLNGGSAALDAAGEASSDPRFGRVAGNGGDWFEIVVTGDGAPGWSDLRGWKVEISQVQGLPFEPDVILEFSQDSFWQRVPHGTILTFTEERAAEGGWDTDLTAENRSFSEGWSWKNLWIGDSRFFNYTSAAFNGYEISALDGRVSQFEISDDQTQFIVRNLQSDIVHGPSGEGIGLVSGIENTGVWRLIGNPGSNLNPYQAGEEESSLAGATASPRSSSFGRPNDWNSGSSLQSFSNFITPYGSYITIAGLSGDLALPSADPDWDEFPNALEFALGGNANDPLSKPLITFRADEREILFLRRTGGTQTGSRYSVNQLEIVVEASLDLQNWEESANQNDPPAGLDPAPAGLEYAVFGLPDSLMAEDQLFFRIRVVFPE